MQTIYVTPEGEGLFHKPALIEIEAAPLTIAERIAAVIRSTRAKDVTVAPAPWGADHG